MFEEKHTLDFDGWVGNWIIVSPVDLKEHYVKLLKAKKDSKIDSIIVKKDVLKVVPVKVK